MTRRETTPPPVQDIDYLARWRQIVERRRVQMEAAYTKAGQSNVDYWGRRAKAYRDALHDRTEEDPFFIRVRRSVDATTTVLDVGRSMLAGFDASQFDAAAIAQGNVAANLKVTITWKGGQGHGQAAGA